MINNLNKLPLHDSKIWKFLEEYDTFWACSTYSTVLDPKKLGISILNELIYVNC